MLLFQTVFSVLYTLNDDSKDTSVIISSIVNSITVNKDSKPKLRLNVLVVLFNLIFAAESKCEVLNGEEQNYIIFYLVNIFADYISEHLCVCAFYNSDSSIRAGHTADEVGVALLQQVQ